ncbi:MAG TPA: helix-turn-helix domain-containing protein, partial [Anaerolineaceae bacterium]
MESRCYNQFCALAYALDAIGERWTLLIVRELLTGPRRFKDLIDGLPGISTNLLSERLKSLVKQGIIDRRVLPPPAGSAVYELTPLGRGLENAVVELGRWGSRLMPPEIEGASLPSIGTVGLAIKSFFRPELAKEIDETIQIEIGCEVLQVRIDRGKLSIDQGITKIPDVVFRTEMAPFLSLFAGQMEP